MERSNFIDIQKQVSVLDNLFQEHINNVKEATNVYSQFASVAKNTFPSEVIKNAKDIDTISAKLATTLSRQARVHTALNKEVASGYTAAQRKIQLEKSQLSLQQQKDRLNAKELKRLEQLNNAYNRISELMKRATAEYNNLAARKNFGIALTEKENARYLQLQARIERFNRVLKKTDADIGKFNRNVGNYGTQWDGLRFQTNQLVRELPAMAYGINVFFGAISNNLPMFIDEVQKARLEQQKMLAEGKQAPSVMSRITGALFNWQTALVLLTTYLITNGEEVLNWTKSLFGAKNALDKVSLAVKHLKDIQEQYSGTSGAILIETEKQNTRLSYHLGILNDLTKSEEERLAINKLLIETYPGYLGNLGKEGLMLDANGKRTEEAVNALRKLREDMRLRIEAEQKYAKIQENLNLAARILDEVDLRRKANAEIRRLQVEGNKDQADFLKERIKLRKESLDEDTEFTKTFGKIGIDSGLYSLAGINTIQGAYNTLISEISTQQKEVAEIMRETSLLDFKPEKDNKDKLTKSTYDYISALASEYELMKLIYEQAIKNNKDIYEDETKTFDQRAKALLKMYEDEKGLNELNKKEQIRLAEIQYKEEMALLEKAEISKSEKLKQEKEIYQKHYYQLNIIEQNWFEEKARIQKEEAQGYDVIIRKLWEYSTLLNGISQGQLNDRGKEIEALSKLNFGQATKGLEQFNENIQQLEKAEKLGKLYAELAKNEDDMQRLVKMGVTMESDAYQKLTAERIELERQIQEEQAKTVKMSIEQVAKLEQAYKQLFGGFTNDIMSSFPAISTLISDEFQGMLTKSQQLIEQYKSELKDLEEGSQEYIDKQKAIADLTRNMVLSVAVQMVEVFQEMYNLMQQNSDAYYQRQFEVLEMQKDTAIKFAGESVVAREEVERQYEERRRQIERDRAKQQKETAIFNAIINTAQAVVAALPNIPLSILVGTLGAVQIRMISSQPLPAFAEGGIHTQGGAMLVNDGKGSNYKETVVTPDGKVIKPQGRNVLMNAPKGTQIFTHDQWQKQISDIVMGEKLHYQKPIDRGITKEDLKDVFNSHYSGQKEITNVTIDKQGINATIIKGATKAKQLNNRIRIKSNG